MALYPAGNEPRRPRRDEYEDALRMIGDDEVEVAEIEAMRSDDGELPENVHKRLLQLESRLVENKAIVSAYTD